MNTLDTGFQNEFLHTTFNCFSFTLTYYILIEIWITGVKIESILNVLNEYQDQINKVIREAQNMNKSVIMEVARKGRDQRGEK